MNDSSSRLLSGNRLLDALPEEEFAALAPHLERVHLKIGTVLANPGDTIKRCYFPIKGMISLLSVTERGETIEVAYVGREGMVGLAWVLSGHEALYQMLVQADSECLVADGDVVRNLFEKGPCLLAAKADVANVSLQSFSYDRGAPVPLADGNVRAVREQASFTYAGISFLYTWRPTNEYRPDSKCNADQGHNSL
jgi:CRP-like cAMP-binding protein